MREHITTEKPEIDVRGIVNLFREVKTDASKYSSEYIIAKLIENGLSGKDALFLFNRFREVISLPPITLPRYASKTNVRKSGSDTQDLGAIIEKAKNRYPDSKLGEVWKKVIASLL